MVVWYHMYMSMVVYMVVWVCMLYVYGILALYVMRVQCAWYDMMISDWYIHVWYDLVLYVRYDLRTDAVRYIIYTDFGRAARLEFYMYCIMWLCVYMWITVWITSILMWITFLLHLQHFYELFWKCCVFVYFRTLSLAISYLLLFSHFFIIS